MERNIVKKIEEIINPIVAKMGFSLYDIEFDHRFLRVYIENPIGVNIDDCARISRVISKELDQTEVIHTKYILEVSSPGIERKLKKKEHYKKVLGKYVVVYLNNHKKRKGFLTDIKEEGIILRKEEKEMFIQFDEIRLSQVKVDTDKLFGRKS